MGRTSDAKERLIEAMIELIWTGSYGSTSVDQICERAGVKKGSFYHFFESKTGAGRHSHRTWLDRSIASSSTRPFRRSFRRSERIWRCFREFP
jgi:TetR/AcrR family transcriptional repressor of nem operon